MILWIGLAVVVIALTFLNQKQLYSSKVKRAYRELRVLADHARNGQSTIEELPKWEANLAEMEKHPNEYNKLEYEVGLRRTFVMYLERHYPQDERLPDLQEAAAYQKDSVWGIKMGDYGPKK
ncbi:hypothetical protein PWYN_27080 [Paenibacillus wynnii]|uniref:Uncharacterized protein n=2 Tax=Paenibacillus wynnii TaxID=268407 RepID=A0A098M9I7_9BACL|nr:hypothetical protein PWYN_27080 [Paenibacillus wynnii]